MVWEARWGFLRKSWERGKGDKRDTKETERPAFESEQAVLPNVVNKEVTSVLPCHSPRPMRYDASERRVRLASFLLVLTDQSVVTLFTTGRARISLKHGLAAPKPNDLVS